MKRLAQARRYAWQHVQAATRQDVEFDVLTATVFSWEWNIDAFMIAASLAMDGAPAKRGRRKLGRCRTTEELALWRAAGVSVESLP